jgi:hypothetical protein
MGPVEDVTIPVRRHLVDVERFAGKPVMARPVGRDDFEERRVDPVRPRGQEGELAPPLSPAPQKSIRILELVAPDLLSQHTLRGHGGAVGRDHESDFPGAHHRQWNPHDLVAPSPQREVDPGVQHPRLITRFAVQSDESAGGKSRTEPLYDETRLVLADETGAQPEEERENRQGEPGVGRENEPASYREHGTLLASESGIAGRVPGGMEAFSREFWDSVKFQTYFITD